MRDGWPRPRELRGRAGRRREEPAHDADAGARRALPLARLFIARTCRENCCGPCAPSSEVLDALCAYPWPGNVRELENAIERAVVLAEGQPKIELTDLPPELRERAAVTPQAAEPLTLAEAERRHILDVLNRCAGNRAATARALGIGENTLWRKLEAYGVPAAR